MSMKRSPKDVAKKRERQRKVKKELIEKRLVDRKERRLEHERELAYEREFNEKNKIGLSKQEVKDKLARNMEILEELEKKFIEEEQLKGDPAQSQKALAQLETIEEFGKIQGELIALNQKKKELEEAGEFTPELAAEHAKKLDEYKQQIEELQKTREANIL
jgi:hypothetical protein